MNPQFDSTNVEYLSRFSEFNAIEENNVDRFNRKVTALVRDGYILIQPIVCWLNGGRPKYVAFLGKKLPF